MLVKRLTNRAYGFPKGARRRVEPVALVCVHITGNSRTAAYEDPRAAALDEWKYANRPDSDGPSAHVYWARDGWGIDAIDNGYAAWSNGDVSSPNTDNPGIRRVLALRARGYNANEGYWEEWENVGHPRGYRITDAQVAAMAERLRALSAAKGLPINRETVHGHWEINGIDRQLCPDRDHEAFLNRLIDLANGSSEEPMRPFPVGVDPKVVDIKPGAQLYLLDLTPGIEVSLGNNKPSPYAYRTGGVNYRVVEVATGGVQHLWLVKVDDCLSIEPAPTGNQPASVTYPVTVGGKPAGSVTLP